MPLADPGDADQRVRRQQIERRAGERSEGVVILQFGRGSRLASRSSATLTAAPVVALTLSPLACTSALPLITCTVSAASGCARSSSAADENVAARR